MAGRPSPPMPTMPCRRMRLPGPTPARRTAVEHGGQLAGRVGDLAGQHVVAGYRPDLRRAQAALDGGPARLLQ
jgi:hypothetical protein